MLARWALPVVAAATLLPAPAPADAQKRSRPVVSVLSNRADLISGGDALVAVRAPRGVRPSRLRVWLRHRGRRRDVTRQLRVRSGGRRRLGLVRGLPLGRSVLRARAGRRRSEPMVIRNHPRGGPVLAGPQLEPWRCQETAVDADCNQPPTYQFLYRSTDPFEAELQPYDPEDPPDDVARTTTDHGYTVPFIVRVETGYLDRDQYRIATLFRPGEPWRAWRPQPQFNRKLLVTHGSSCGVDYGVGNAPSVVKDRNGVGAIVPGAPDDSGRSPEVALGRGFAVMSTALAHNGHNCNIALQAEALVMLKEHLIETYGTLRYTIATGCSGGAVTMQQVANAYPGMYQGLLPQCAYPDTLSPGTQFADLHLLRGYFEDPGKWSVPWSPHQFGAVEGHLSHLNAITADEGLFKGAIDPTADCGVPAERRYHPQDNPAGVRCSILDAMINVLGPRPREDWSEVERKVGRGFAGVPFGNRGVQYGLVALGRGEITAEQFVDLNHRIGGLDIDARPTPERLDGDDRAVANAFRSGALNSAENLDRVAIIGLAGADPGAAHDFSHAMWTRVRLDQQHGHHRNHVLWFGHEPLRGDSRYTTQGLLEMDRWLAAVEAGPSRGPLADRIVAARPADLTDRCTQVPSFELCENPDLRTYYGTPRSAAGGPVTDDVTECRLRPLDRTEYPVSFSDDQWARLEATFPDGVCDWSRPAANRRPVVPWLSYQRRGGRVVHGGRPLGPAPRRTQTGWQGPAFR